MGIDIRKLLEELVNSRGSDLAFNGKKSSSGTY